MIETILRKMHAWSRLGEKTDENGSKIFAHTPRDFPQAYLHCFFSPLSQNKWNDYDFELSDQLKILYTECNGLSIFAGNLSIYGIRENYNRNSAAAQFQPFNLKDHDREHRTIFHPLKKGIKDNRIFFGSYYWDGSGVYVVKGNDMVFRCLRDENKPINEWKNIESFLIEEYNRLENLFDSNGYLKNEDTPTTP